MFKLFSTTEKPTSSHSRSKTQPHLYPSSENYSASLTSTAIVNGHEFEFINPISAPPTVLRHHEPLSGAPVTEPTKAHQRTLTEQVRSTRDLPSLIAEASESDVTTSSDFVQTSSFALPPSLSGFQVSPEQSRQSSPTRSNRLSLFSSERDTQAKAGEKVTKLANWFSGESEPINIGILPSPTKEKADPLESMVASSEVRPSSMLNRCSTAQSTSKPAMASRFSFFATKAPTARPMRKLPDLNDELIEMDICSSLFPTGPRDPFSPAAFKNLQQKAEGLLHRLQTAYKERTIALHDMTVEKETLGEETEGAETKARHLKTQLDDLSTKLAEQDEVMMGLVDELAQEKLARREEQEARKRSIRLIQHNTPPKTDDRRMSLTNTVSDSGFESDDDSSAESVFSRQNGCQSPTMSMSSVSTNNSPETAFAPDLYSRTTIPQAARLRVPMSQPLKNPVVDELIQSSCQKCNRAPASDTRDVNGGLQEENKYLKQRIHELEGALDGCLDIVGGLA